MLQQTCPSKLTCLPSNSWEVCSKTDKREHINILLGINKTAMLKLLNNPDAHSLTHRLEKHAQVITLAVWWAVLFQVKDFSTVKSVYSDNNFILFLDDFVINSRNIVFTLPGIRA